MPRRFHGTFAAVLPVCALLASKFAASTVVAESVAVCPRVCIFDIDNTVTVGEHCEVLRAEVISEPAPQWPSHSGTTTVAKQAIQECHTNGYRIAFASAESKDEERNSKQFEFIASLEPVLGMFNKEFFSSPAYQGAWNVLARSSSEERLEFAHKQPMIMNILRYYDVPYSCFNQSIMFDDDVQNLHAASMLRLKVAQASIECGGSYCSSGCGLSSAALEVIESPALALVSQGATMSTTVAEAATVANATMRGFLASRSTLESVDSEGIAGDALEDRTASIVLASSTADPIRTSNVDNELSAATTSSAFIIFASAIVLQMLFH